MSVVAVGPPVAPALGDRIARMDAAAAGAGDRVRRLLATAGRGLPASLDVDTGEFAQTMRLTDEAYAVVRAEGTSTRYAAVAALGLARLAPAAQRSALHGWSAANLAREVGRRVLRQSDAGATALAAWAVVETSGDVDPSLVARMGVDLSSGRPLSTVELSWIAIAAAEVGDGAAPVRAEAIDRLLAAQQPSGLFPHVVPASSHRRWRRHVGSFADQVYPVQALARAYRRTGDPTLLAAAEAAADTICERQGPDGQWWWHYDVRTGDVVERFPVYSVHQHAMAPMALFDLAEAGGTDRTAAVARGLGWFDSHPEVVQGRDAEALGAIWRKVGRREPRKLVRAVSAATTSVRPGLQARGLDRMFPPDRVDHECRPYELGWLLHAWLPARAPDRD